MANGLEPDRPELGGQSMAMELAERLDGKADINRLCRWLAVLEVVPIGTLEVDEGKRDATE